MAGDLNDRLRYNDWANATLYGALKKQTAPESALRAFQHLLETELTWSCRILGMDNPDLKLWATVPAETREAWFVTARDQMRRVAANEYASEFGRSFQYRNYSGQPFEDAVEEVLEHTLIHSAQYRGEAAGLSNAAGVQMPDLDYIFWKRNGSPSAE